MRRVTSCRRVCSNWLRALYAPAFESSSKYTVIEGFFGFGDSERISSTRGVPRVTVDLLATPAKWNVFSVSCVVGSPMDCAAMMPTISPGFTTAFL